MAAAVPNNWYAQREVLSLLGYDGDPAATSIFSNSGVKGRCLSLVGSVCLWRSTVPKSLWRRVAMAALVLIGFPTIGLGPLYLLGASSHRCG
jgi:hypothetical protein